VDGELPDALPERPRPGYWLTRVLFPRALGLIYGVAFLSLGNQVRGLIGQDGLLPARLYLREVAQELGAGWPAWSALPTLFWASTSDGFMQASASPRLRRTRSAPSYIATSSRAAARRAGGSAAASANGSRHPRSRTKASPSTSAAAAGSISGGWRAMV
jgi:hypothetical protein